MAGEHDLPVRLRRWAESDLALLTALLGDPTMTEYLGGPESAEQLAARHQRYLELPGTGTGEMFVILAGDEREPAGSIGYWDVEHGGEAAFETGWSVLPAFQGRGIAAKATAALLDVARGKRTYRYVFAFPSVENGASNALCKKVGFTFMGEEGFEYPKGNPIRCNTWRFALW